MHQGHSNVRELALARARSLHVLKQGLDQEPWEVLSLDKMSTIIDERLAELSKSLGEEAALDQVEKEFGL